MTVTPEKSRSVKRLQVSSARITAPRPSLKSSCHLQFTIFSNRKAWQPSSAAARCTRQVLFSGAPDMSKCCRPCRRLPPNPRKHSQRSGCHEKFQAMFKCCKFVIQSANSMSGCRLPRRSSKCFRFGIIGINFSMIGTVAESLREFSPMSSSVRDGKPCPSARPLTNAASPVGVIFVPRRPSLRKCE